MGASAAREWLDRRGADVPPPLQQRMLEAVATVDADTAGGNAAGVSAVLADAALVCLTAALELCDDRAAALHLLAADALITAACEAASVSADPASGATSQNSAGALHALCDDLAPARLAARMADA